MTYAVAVRLQRGVVFAADTRTNAGIDNVSQFRKLHFWRRTGDRVLVLLTAGNLAVSQSVISIINEQLSPEAPTDRPTLMNVSSMYRAARLVGDAVREVRAIDGPSLDASKTGFSVSCILGGQVGDEEPRLFQIYDEGNFIEATDDTPYLQIGEQSMVSRFSTAWCTPKCGLARSLSSFCYRSMQRCARTFQSACQSISCCMSATHWICDACGESTRMTTIIESFPTNGPKPSGLRLPAWTSTKIDRQRSPSRPRSSSTISNAGVFFVHKTSRKNAAYRVRFTARIPPVLRTERMAHLDPAGGCCTAGFRSGLRRVGVRSTR